tara:strand:+ start:2838 stop:2963 length:126 start_codon:yes stop_codon:yes gene_type:complete
MLNGKIKKVEVIDGVVKECVLGIGHSDGEINCFITKQKEKL